MLYNVLCIIYAAFNTFFIEVMQVGVQSHRKSFIKLGLNVNVIKRFSELFTKLSAYFLIVLTVVTPIVA
jgi:hypothetical protein